MKKLLIVLFMLFAVQASAQHWIYTSAKIYILNAAGSDTLYTLDAGTNQFSLRHDADDDSSFYILDADGGTPIFIVDAVNERVGIGVAAPSVSLDVSGTIAGTTITGANVTTGANPGHTHTGSSLSGIDISDDTNLSGGTNATLNGDAIDVDDAFLVNDAADEMLLADATTNVVTDILDLSHTGGTVAAGFGTGIRFDIEDAGGIEEQASIDVSLDVVTDAAEEASIIFRHNVAGTMQESMRIDG